MMDLIQVLTGLSQKSYRPLLLPFHWLEQGTGSLREGHSYYTKKEEALMIHSSNVFSVPRP